MLEYCRVRPDAIPPTRANPSDAGLDIYFNPDDSSMAGVMLYPGESKLFQTGLKFGIPHGYMLEVKNRSGNASKRSLIVGACVVVPVVVGGVQPQSKTPPSPLFRFSG